MNVPLRTALSDKRGREMWTFDDIAEIVKIIVRYLVRWVVAVIMVTILVVLVWGWVIPDVFAGSVEQGILPASITLVQALKLGILFSVLGVGRYGSISSSET